MHGLGVLTDCGRVAKMHVSQRNRSHLRHSSPWSDAVGDRTPLVGVWWRSSQR
jgi:hypothetical protein